MLVVRNDAISLKHFDWHQFFFQRICFINLNGVRSVYTVILTDIESDLLVIWSRDTLSIFYPLPFPLKVLYVNLDRQLNVVNKPIM